MTEESLRFLDALHDAVCVVDRAGTIVAANRAAARVLGEARDALAGRELSALCAPISEPVDAFLQRCFGTGERCIGALRIAGHPARVEGSRVPGETDGRPVALLRLLPREIAASPFLLLNERLEELQAEVARRVRAEATLSAKLAELAESDRQKSHFLALLSHELRNPLAPIRTMLHVMRQNVRPGDLERNVALMERNVNHLVRLVDDLLDLSRISTGKIQVKVGQVDLGEVVELAASGVRAKAQVKQQEVEVLAPGGLVAMADADRLRQVLGNLLDNACKFTPPGGRIRVRAEAGPDAALIHVQDTGPGIPAEFVPRLFSFFAQGDGALDRVEQGLGLGLALARNLIELQGGSIALQPSAQGAHFTVSVPLRAAAPRVEEAPR